MLKFKHISVAGFALFAALGFSGSNAQAQWTGCGAGVFGGIVDANLGPLGPNVDLSSQGQLAGITLNCDYRVQAFVLGAFAEYAWLFGDLEKLGAQTDFTLGGRVGVLISPTSLLYAHAGWGQSDIKGIGTLENIKLGLGNEFRIPNSPIYLDMRYSYVMFDDSKIPSSVDLDAHVFRLGLNLKFGPGAFGGKGAVFDTETGKKCDPKMANC